MTVWYLKEESNLEPISLLQRPKGHPISSTHQLTDPPPLLGDLPSHFSLHSVQFKQALSNTWAVRVPANPTNVRTITAFQRDQHMKARGSEIGLYSACAAGVQGGGDFDHAPAMMPLSSLTKNCECHGAPFHVGQTSHSSMKTGKNVQVKLLLSFHFPSAATARERASCT